MVQRIWEITVTLYFIFRLVHCSSEDVSFNSIFLNVLEGIEQFYLLMWFTKTRLETPFKGDNVKALVKTAIKIWLDVRYSTFNIQILNVEYRISN